MIRAAAIAALALLAACGLALAATWLGHGWAAHHGDYRHLYPRPTGGWHTPASPTP